MKSIQAEEWKKIRDLASAVSRAAKDDNYPLSHIHCRTLIDFLDSLQDKYGPLPRILATKADYMEDDEIRLCLYEKAFEISETEHNHMECVFIADSLILLYLEDIDVPNYEMAHRWLKRMEFSLRNCPDEHFSQAAERYRSLISGHEFGRF